MPQPQYDRRAHRPSDPCDNRADWGRVVVVASGPSFTESNIEAIVCAQRYGFKVLAVNDNWKRLPGADVLFAGDLPWWREYAPAVRASGFLGELWTQSRPAAEAYRLRYVQAVNAKGLCRAAGRLHSGGSSGYMAINLAWHFGAREMILVGFDCTNTGGAMHWFGDHPDTLPRMGPYRTWQEYFPLLAKDLEADGVDVVIAGSSALSCWRLVDLKEHVGRLVC